jgi:hypothetical protein
VKKGIRIHHMVLLLAVLVAVMPRTSSACAVCMGASDSAIAPAMNAAIFLMLGFIGTILAAIGGFIFYLSRRAKMPLPPHEELSGMIYKEGHKHHA